MTNFKGTKGKWVITEGDPNGVEIEAIRIQTLYAPMWDIAAVWGDLDSNQSKANALLISKAPDMLEMLEKVSNILNVDEFLHDTSIRQYFYHQIQEINDLIKESTKL